MSGDRALARTVPAGAVGIASAFVITIVDGGIFRFTRSAHFCTGAIPPADALDTCPYAADAIPNVNRMKKPNSAVFFRFVMTSPPARRASAVGKLESYA